MLWKHLVNIWLQFQSVKLVFAHKFTFDTEAEDFSIIQNSRRFNFNLHRDSLISVPETPTTEPTTNEPSTSHVTTVETTTNATTTQYLMYLVFLR